MPLSGTLRLGDLELSWLDCNVRHRNRIASHEAPDVPGAIQESTGRGPYQIEATTQLAGGWETMLDALVRAVDVEQEGDLTLADGRLIHVAITEMEEGWKQVDGVSIRLSMSEDGEVDSYSVPDAPRLARTAPDFARANGWSQVAALLDTLRDALEAFTPPTLGELVGMYGAAAVALIEVEEAALGTDDRDGMIAAAGAVIIRAAALAALPVGAREML